MIIKMLMFPAILFLVLYFVIVQVVPTAKAISATKEEIVKEQENLVEANQQLQDVQNFKNDIQSHTAEQDFIFDFVPNDQKEEILLSDISQLATETGIDLFSLGFSEGKSGVRSSAATDGTAYMMEGKVIASGNYEEFKQFMNKLFLIKRLYGFKTFDLTKSTQKKDDEEDAEDKELMLSGVITFAYAYVPGVGVVSPNAVSNSINFDLINTVMDASANTEPLVTETSYRKNPFLP